MPANVSVTAWRPAKHADKKLIEIVVCPSSPGTQTQTDDSPGPDVNPNTVRAPFLYIKADAIARKADDGTCQFHLEQRAEHCLNAETGGADNIVD